VDVVAKVALGSPAVTTLRALLRQWPTAADAGGRAPLLASSALVGMAFRSLYNRPESIALVRSGSDDEPYWKAALDYGASGNLQAVLDEYVHALRDHLGVRGRPLRAAMQIGAAVADAASMSAVRLGYDYVKTSGDGSVTLGQDFIRCRFALRYGNSADRTEDDKQETRADQVRGAFNSPFRPFVLASTSVGQEGLDFHLYCHRIVHWNLPSNPVDLEQREGRVHRFKCHVVRRNAAARGISALDGLADPWDSLFAAAEAMRGDASDLVPYWVLPGEHRIARHVPLLPLSRDIGRWSDLQRSIALYRVAFGQPRQEDLLELLASRGTTAEEATMACIDLAPTP
jgi:hypothetical protein